MSTDQQTQPNIAASIATDIANECIRFESSPEYKEMLQNHVRKLYDSAIKDIFSWGDYPKKVKTALEQALPGDISKLVDLPKYNLLMAKELESLWADNALPELLIKQTKDLVLDFVKSHELPEYVYLSELMETFIECHKEEATEERWERPEVLLQERDYPVANYWSLGLNKEQRSTRSSYSSKEKEHTFQFDNDLCFSEKRDHDNNTSILHEGHKLYSLYAGKMDSDFLGKEVTQFRNKFEKLIAALYYGKTLLIKDTDDLDGHYYPNAD